MQTNPELAKPEVSNLYRNYVLAMLTLVYVFNFIDRQIVVILGESIKKDMHLSDADLGWLSGVAFAFFYVILGIPIARAADRGNRKNVVTVSLALWSIMTAVCGFAGNFFQLLLARIGVGIGEAGGSPPAHAMISDYFPPRKRSTALAIYSAGIYIGMMVGFVMGGYLNQSLGWRKAFMLVGAPGAVFAILVYLTIREPKRGATDQAGVTETHSFLAVVKRLFASPTFVFLAMATSLHVFCIYGLANWAPSFLSRLHGLSPAQRGLALGLASGIGGGIGSFGGGWLTDRFGKRDIRWYMRIPAIAVLFSVFFEALALFSPNTTLSVIGFGFVAALQSSYLGPAVSVAHRLVPASMRAMASAWLFLCLNLIGLGLGPVVVGKISDLLAPRYGVESLRWAMSIVILISLGAMALFFVTAKKMKAELS
jgi:MFS family permease